MPPPSNPSHPTSRRSGKTAEESSRIEEKRRAQKVHRLMAEVAIMLKGFQSTPPADPMKPSEVFKLALFQAKTDLLKNKRDRLVKFREIRDHIALCEAADDFLKSNGKGAIMQSQVHQKWNELVAWSRKAEELILTGMEQVATVPGHFVGTELPSLEDIQKRLEAAPEHRADMLGRLRELLKEIPADVSENGVLDKNFEAYLLFTERSSAVAVPRITELLKTLSQENEVNPALLTVERYESALTALRNRRLSQGETLVSARRLHAEGDYVAATAAITSLGSRFPDLDYSVVEEIRSLENAVSRLDRFSGMELVRAVEALATSRTNLPADCPLHLKLSKAKERGLNKASRSRLILGTLAIFTVVGVALAVFAGIGLANKSKLEEEKRLVRQAEELKRIRAAEAEAEARRAQMAEESRNAQLESLNPQSTQNSNGTQNPEKEAFLTLNRGATFSVAFGPGVPEMNLKWIPEGAFLMGGEQGPNDSRITPVAIRRGFWASTHETTQAQWTFLMDNNPSEHSGPNLPVEQIHWSEAMRFCRVLTEREQRSGRLPKGLAYSLPTEAQWEYACRAGDMGDSPKDMNAVAWSMDNSGAKTNPVGTLAPNAWGLHDMFGNVSEWCLDWYGPYSGNSVSDPAGPKDGRRRVNRGGSWLGTQADYRYHRREQDIPELRSKNIGFRVVLVQQ